METNDRSQEHLPLTAVSLMALLCLLWGGNLVSIKVSNQGIPPILGAAMRSVLASGLLWIYARCSGRRFFIKRDYLAHGATIGFSFRHVVSVPLLGACFHRRLQVRNIHLHPPFLGSDCSAFRIAERTIDMDENCRAIRRVRWFNFGVWRKIFHFGASVLAR